MNDSRVLGPKEAAELLKVGVSTVQRWIDAGLIQAHRTPGGHRRIAFRDLVEFAQAHGFRIAESQPLDQLRVLIVDEEKEVQTVLDAALHKINSQLQIQVATNGFSAGVQVVEQAPDVVFLSMTMPGTDGIEMCRMIKGDSQLKKARIIGMPDAGDALQSAGFLDAGAEEIVSKPLDLQKLSVVLNRIRGLGASE